MKINRSENGADNRGGLWFEKRRSKYGSKCSLIGLEELLVTVNPQQRVASSVSCRRRKLLLLLIVVA